MKLLKRFSLILFIALIFTFFYMNLSPVSASPGRTDSNGGHVCRTNCENYGLGYGEYHYHNGESSSSTRSEYDYNNPPNSETITGEVDGNTTKLTDREDNKIKELEQDNEEKQQKINEIKEELRISKDKRDSFKRKNEEMEEELENLGKTQEELESLNKTLEEKENVIIEKNAIIKKLNNTIIIILSAAGFAVVIIGLSLYLKKRKIN